MRLRANLMIFTSAAFCLLCGCATIQPQVANMVPPIPIPMHYTTPNTVLEIGVVSGGEETEPMFKGYRISNQDLRSALEKTLQKMGYRLTWGGVKPDYILKARILNQIQPAFGFDMTVTLRVKYELTQPDNLAFHWERDIQSLYAASFNEAFFGWERLRKANEGAVRENLKKLLEELHKLGL